jgi:LacI family transcriptional regulator
MSTPTIDDVAKTAGVSIKTVSRVVNSEPNVRETTRQRVQQAINQLNYRPDKSARSLKSRRSYLVGLVYDDPSIYDIPSSGYVIKIQQGVLSVCKRMHYEMVIHPCNYRDPDIARELKSLVKYSRLDGVVVAPPLSGMATVVEAFKSVNCPVINISPGPDSNGAERIETNDRAASRDMTNYLISLGHRRIAFIDGHEDHDALKQRVHGYRDALKENGLDCDESLIRRGDNSIRSGDLCAESLLRQEPRPTAVFACNDDMAAGVLRTAQRLGLEVPRDLSIAGFDDVPLAQQTYPALTTVRQPLVRMAALAAERLLQEIGSVPNESDVSVVDAELVIRASTGPAPT